MRICYKSSHLTKLEGFLKYINSLYTASCYSHSPQVFDECRICDQYLTSYLFLWVVHNRSSHSKIGRKKQAFFLLQRCWVYLCAESVRTIISKIIILKSKYTLGVLLFRCLFLLFSKSNNCTDEITKLEPCTCQKLDSLLWKTLQINSKTY